MNFGTKIYFQKFNYVHLYESHRQKFYGKLTKEKNHILIHCIIKVMMHWGEFILLITTCIFFYNQRYVISDDKQYLSGIKIFTRIYYMFSRAFPTIIPSYWCKILYIHHAHCVIFKGRLHAIKLHTRTIHYVSVYIKTFLEKWIQAIS